VGAGGVVHSQFRRECSEASVLNTAVLDCSSSGMVTVAGELWTWAAFGGHRNGSFLPSEVSPLGRLSCNQAVPAHPLSFITRVGKGKMFWGRALYEWPTIRAQSQKITSNDIDAGRWREFGRNYFA
jgi:hypothetical protein